jgi:predicted ATPase
VLELAACVGDRFDPAVLLTVGRLDRDGLAAHLHGLEQAGLIDSVGHGYRFAHDRIRTSLLERLDPAARGRLHWAIGRHLLELAGGPAALAEQPGEALFVVVDQLDAGLAAVGSELDTAARHELAVLDTRAGERALAGAAWRVARRYFEHALTLLGPGDLREPSRFVAHFGHAQALSLDGQHDAADTAFETLLRTDLRGRSSSAAPASSTARSACRPRRRCSS